MAIDRTSKKGKVLDIPANAPTIGTPTDAGDGTTANVAFTAPSTATGGPIFSYTVTSNPGSFTATGTSSPLTITGLTTGTPYTFTAVATNPTGNSPASAASSSLTLAVPQYYQSIATSALSADGNVTFSSIPQTFTHLQLRFLAKSSFAGTGTANMYIAFNSDTTAANYAGHAFSATGSAVSSSGGTSDNTFAIIPEGNAGVAGSTFGMGVIDIYNYSNTSTYTVTKSISGYDLNNSGFIRFRGNIWLNTAAVTSISITQGSASYKNGSHFALYGLKV